MSDEYEYGPWVGWNNGQNPPPPRETVQVIMFGGLGQLRWENMKSHDVAWSRGNIIAYRIATPKPKRELVVGRWYRGNGGIWKQCIFSEPNGDGGYFRVAPVCADATWRPMTGIDWSTPPRDEAPE